MESLNYILVPLLLGVIASFLIVFFRNRRHADEDCLNKRDFTIRSSLFWSVIMLIVAVLLVVILIVCNISKPILLLNIILPILILVFAYGSLQGFREKIRIKDNDIFHTPPIGKTRKYTFSELEKIKCKKTAIYAYKNGKVIFSVEPSALGTSALVSLAKAKGVNVE